MKYFNPDEYSQDLDWLEAQGLPTLTLWVGDKDSMRPMPKGHRPWTRTDLYDEDGSPLYRTTKTIDFVLNTGSVARVPKGFLFDGASIPKWAQWLIGKPMGKYALSALLHDWLYASRVLGDNKYGRTQADRIFSECLRAQRISGWRRRAMYSAVRAGGSYAYHETDERVECQSLMDSYISYNPFYDYFIYPRWKKYI